MTGVEESVPEPSVPSPPTTGYVMAQKLLSKDQTQGKSHCPIDWFIADQESNTWCSDDLLFWSTWGEIFANIYGFIKKNIQHVSYMYIFYTWRLCYNLLNCVNWYNVKSEYFIL